LQERLARLETEMENSRRDRWGLADIHGARPEQRTADIAREIGLATDRLRELLAED
jgi:hypothetical protein